MSKKKIENLAVEEETAPSAPVADVPAEAPSVPVEAIPAAEATPAPPEVVKPVDNSALIRQDFLRRIGDFQPEYEFCQVCQNSGLSLSVAWQKGLREIALYRYQLYRVFAQPSFPTSVVWPKAPDVSYITAQLPKC